MTKAEREIIYRWLQLDSVYSVCHNHWPDGQREAEIKDEGVCEECAVFHAMSRLLDKVEADDQ